MRCGVRGVGCAYCCWKKSDWFSAWSLAALSASKSCSECEAAACCCWGRNGRAYLLLLLEDILEILVLFLHVHHFVFLLAHPAALFLQQLVEHGNHMRCELNEVAPQLDLHCRHRRYVLHVIRWERPAVHLQNTVCYTPPCSSASSISLSKSQVLQTFSRRRRRCTLPFFFDYSLQPLKCSI